MSDKKDHNKNRKDKPWDHDGIDHWKIDAFSENDNIGGSFLEESSFQVMFPKYREQYFKETIGQIKDSLKPFFIKVDLDLIKGIISVRTTNRTFDPFIIIKARDFVKLISRSVPFENAKTILLDGSFCEFIKIGGLCSTREKYIKRRQRLVGPNGATLKAIELLTESYILIQGATVSVITKDCKSINTISKIVYDCFKNIHPIYHIKELMIRKELAKNPEMANISWDRFLPNFKKRHSNKSKKKRTKVVKEEKPLFPPEPTPRKEDLLMQSGEYFAVKKTKELEKKKRDLKRVKVDDK